MSVGIVVDDRGEQLESAVIRCQASEMKRADKKNPPPPHKKRSDLPTSVRDNNAQRIQ